MAEVWRTAWLEVRQHPNRLVATGLAIAISVAFIVSCLSFVATETNSIGRRATAKTSSSDVVVSGSEDRDNLLQERIRTVPGVAQVSATYDGFAEFASPKGSGALNLTTLPAVGFRWLELSAGGWPATADEVAIGALTAEAYDLRVGSMISFAGESDASSRAMRVTGILDQHRSLFGDLENSAVVPASYLASRPDGLTYPTVLVQAQPGVSPDTLVDRVRKVTGSDADVRTSADLSRQALEGLTHSAAVFTYLLLIFVAVALLVGTMIIVNTFTIIVAQRRRTIALLRAVGASTRQVRRQLAAEATLIGVLGSVAGVALGLGVAVAASAVTGSLADGLRAPVGQLAGAFGAGVLVTWLAALVPAHGATRVAPTEALRPVTEPATRRRTTRRHGLASGLIVAAGAVAVAMALGADQHNVVYAIGASMVLAAGILAAAPVFLPAVLRLAGQLTGRLGTVHQLGAANLVRNPSRAAATCIALMLGVGLIVTLQVGAASLKATTNDSLNAKFPVDVTVRNPKGALAPGVAAAVAAVPGIRATTPVRVTTARVAGAGPDAPDVSVAGLRPDAGAVVAAGFDQLAPGVALADRFTLEMLGRKSGDRLTLRHSGRDASFTVQLSDVADSGTVVIQDTALARLAPGAPVAALWAAAADRTQAAAVITDVRKAAGLQPGLDLGGSLAESASINTLLDTVLQIATALLAVAVVIALIGVGNTLGLSVIERTQESALLRALGLQRRQLRLMLMAEAILLALVGAGVGIGAGVLFGVVGVAALVKETSLRALHVSMSVPQTFAVVAITALAGALASVLPGRRAALATPTAALVET